jgi:hypothetical protein
VPITISADDLRSIRAIQIAARAADWMKCRTGTGQDAFRVPSQHQPGRYYFVTASSCECPDFRRSQLAAVESSDDDGACKHVLAVRLYCELVRAQQYLKRDHLRLVSSD